MDLYSHRLILYLPLHLPLHRPKLILKWLLRMGLHSLEERISEDGEDCKITLWDLRDTLNRLSLMESWDWMQLMLLIMYSGDHNLNIKLHTLPVVLNLLQKKPFLY